MTHHYCCSVFQCYGEHLYKCHPVYLGIARLGGGGGGVGGKQFEIAIAIPHVKKVQLCQVCLTSNIFEQLDVLTFDGEANWHKYISQNSKLSEWDMLSVCV